MTGTLNYRARLPWRPPLLLLTANRWSVPHFSRPIDVEHSAVATRQMLEYNRTSRCGKQVEGSYALQTACLYGVGTAQNGQLAYSTQALWLRGAWEY